jgi:hypothetical protein
VNAESQVKYCSKEGRNVELSVFPLQNEEVSVMMMARPRETSGTSTEHCQMTVDLDDLMASTYDRVYAAVAYSTLEEQIRDPENQYTQDCNHSLQARYFSIDFGELGRVFGGMVVGDRWIRIDRADPNFLWERSDRHEIKFWNIFVSLREFSMVVVRTVRS